MVSDQKLGLYSEYFCPEDCDNPLTVISGTSFTNRAILKKEAVHQHISKETNPSQVQLQPPWLSQLSGVVESKAT